MNLLQDNRMMDWMSSGLFKSFTMNSGLRYQRCMNVTIIYAVLYLLMLILLKVDCCSLYQ